MTDHRSLHEIIKTQDGGYLLVMCGTAHAAGHLTGTSLDAAIAEAAGPAIFPIALVPNEHAPADAILAAGAPLATADEVAA